MEKSYGTVIFKKGTILYILDNKKFDDFNYYDSTKQPLIFCVCHPSEGNILCKYVHYIKLKKDIKLLFLIEGTERARIQSFLKFATNEYNIKNNNKILNLCKRDLNNNNLDGFITSIDNTDKLEIGLISSNKNYKHYKTTILQCDWMDSIRISKNIIKQKYWGQLYKVVLPIQIHLNKRYKKMIKKYIKYENKIGYISNNVFSIMIKDNNIQIKYYDENIDVINIKWYDDEPYRLL